MQTSSQRRTLSAGGAEGRRKEEELGVGTVFKKRQPLCLLGTLGYGRGGREPDGGGAKGEGGMQIKGARRRPWSEVRCRQRKKKKQKKRVEHCRSLKGPKTSQSYTQRACVFIAFLKTQSIELK